MALKKDFERELLQFLHARTHRVRSIIWAVPGAAPKMDQKKILSLIVRLQSLAKSALLRMKPAKAILGRYDYKKQWHPKRGKGYGTVTKQKNFKDWYDSHITTQNCVYVFWRRSNCLYVGRTLNGKGRPASQFDKSWFGKATRVDVYGFDRKRDVPRFECMFTHRHEPSYSKIKPASKKYYTRCPICAARRVVRDEIKRI